MSEASGRRDGFFAATRPRAMLANGDSPARGIGRSMQEIERYRGSLLGLPTLYLSGYINRNRAEYYRVLLAVTREGAWPELILFLLEALCRQATETKQTFFRVMELHREIKETIRREHRKIYSADLVDCLFTFPVITPVKLAQILGVHYTTATRRLTALSEAGILKDAFHKRYHLLVNHRVMEIIGG